MLRLVYTCLLVVFLPFIVLKLYIGNRKRPAYGRRFLQHFAWGLSQTLKSKKTIWVHAASVGEINAARLLLKRLAECEPDTQLVITTTTTTGARALSQLDIAHRHYFAPLDYPWVVARFLKCVRPDVFLLFEVELWPNWLHACTGQNIPVILVNARMSQRTYQRYQLVRPFFQSMTQNIDMLLCQYHSDYERYKKLGIAPKRLHVTGSLKFECAVQPQQQKKGQALRNQMSPKRLVWIAGSTHEGEEHILLQLHKRLLQQFPELLLFLVPRHVERAAHVQTLCRQHKLQVTFRTQSEIPDAQARVYLCDTTGELSMLYGACDLAFVGGSLVEHGGQNPLEPAAVGLPILFGPHIFNFTQIYRELSACGAGVCCHTLDDMQKQLTLLLENAQKRLEMGANALNFIQNNQGALERACQLMSRYIPAVYPSSNADQCEALKAKVG